jgi:phosphoenolpyruvate synthase/pyruvate phosphate dikinase
MSGKAKNLSIMTQDGISVPRWFKVPAKFHKDFLDSHYKEIHEILSSFPPEEAAVRVRDEVFLNPEYTSRKLDEFLAAKVSSELPEVAFFATRSSGTCSTKNGAVREDSSALSLAGQFDSYLKVSRGSLVMAVRAVWASMLNARSIIEFSAATDRCYVEDSSMVVVVQEFHAASASAVLMGQCPLEAPGVGVIESTVGACEAIVAGLTVPDCIRFDRETGKILSWEIGSKSHIVKLTPFSTPNEPNRSLVPTAAEIRQLSALTVSQCAELIVLSKRLENLFGGKPQDIEAIFCDDVLHVLQSRDVTTLTQ